MPLYSLLVWEFMFIKKHLSFTSRSLYSDNSVSTRLLLGKLPLVWNILPVRLLRCIFWFRGRDFSSRTENQVTKVLCWPRLGRWNENLSIGNFLQWKSKKHSKACDFFFFRFIFLWMTDFTERRQRTLPFASSLLKELQPRSQGSGTYFESLSRYSGPKTQAVFCFLLSS